MIDTILTDKEWEKIKISIPDNKSEAGKKGKPARDHRQVLEIILWVLRTGSPWRAIPKEICPWSTVYNRFKKWLKEGVWRSIWEALKHVLNKEHIFWTQMLSRQQKLQKRMEEQEYEYQRIFINSSKWEKL